MDKKRYIIIGRSTCPFCAQAEDLCLALGVSHVFLDYKDKEEILDDYKTFHDQLTVPIVLENDLKTGLTNKIGGYDSLLKALK